MGTISTLIDDDINRRKIKLRQINQDKPIGSYRKQITTIISKQPNKFKTIEPKGTSTSGKHLKPLAKGIHSSRKKSSFKAERNQSVDLLTESLTNLNQLKLPQIPQNLITASIDSTTIHLQDSLNPTKHRTENFRSQGKEDTDKRKQTKYKISGINQIPQSSNTPAPVTRTLPASYFTKPHLGLQLLTNTSISKCSHSNNASKQSLTVVFKDPRLSDRYCNIETNGDLEDSRARLLTDANVESSKGKALKDLSDLILKHASSLDRKLNKSYDFKATLRRLQKSFSQPEEELFIQDQVESNNLKDVIFACKEASSRLYKPKHRKVESILENLDKTKLRIESQYRKSDGGKAY